MQQCRYWPFHLYILLLWNEECKAALQEGCESRPMNLVQQNSISVELSTRTLEILILAVFVNTATIYACKSWMFALPFSETFGTI